MVLKLSSNPSGRANRWWARDPRRHRANRSPRRAGPTRWLPLDAPDPGGVAGHLVGQHPHPVRVRDRRPRRWCRRRAPGPAAPRPAARRARPSSRPAPSRASETPTERPSRRRTRRSRRQGSTAGKRPPAEGVPRHRGRRSLERIDRAVLAPVLEGRRDRVLLVDQDQEVADGHEQDVGVAVESSMAQSASTSVENDARRASDLRSRGCSPCRRVRRSNTPRRSGSPPLRPWPPAPRSPPGGRPEVAM